MGRETGRGPTQAASEPSEPTRTASGPRGPAPSPPGHPKASGTAPAPPLSRGGACGGGQRLLGPDWSWTARLPSPLNARLPHSEEIPNLSVSPEPSLMAYFPAPAGSVARSLATPPAPSSNTPHFLTSSARGAQLPNVRSLESRHTLRRPRLRLPACFARVTLAQPIRPRLSWRPRLHGPIGMRLGEGVCSRSRSWKPVLRVE